VASCDSAGRLGVAGERYVFPEARFMSHFETHARWCIVVADAAGPTRRVPEQSRSNRVPIQYCGLGEPTTMLQKALHRAVRLSAAARVLATAAEAHRMHWQGALWCVRPEHRFVSECPGWSALTTASAVLWIAARAPSALVTILPARCYVADEWTLAVSLHSALYELPLAVDDVVTLGMTTTESVIDEDSMTLCASVGRPTGTVPVSRSDPRSSSAEASAQRRALIASGIYIGYAGTLAMQLYKYWPGLTHELLRQLAGAPEKCGERRVPPSLAREALLAAPRAYWDCPPWVARQVFRVNPCGWSGLRSTRAIERIACPQRGRYANSKGMLASRREKRAEG
jgi:mannose-1-phosphate guanylyltransferase